MKEVKMKTNFHLKNVSEITTESLISVSEGTLSSTYVSETSLKSFVYNEMSDFPVQARSEIDQLQENALVLKDLNDRLSFLSKEIRYLLNLK